MRAQENYELQNMVREYNEFRLCRELHIDPDELDKKDSMTVQKWMAFLAAEREAEKWYRDHPKEV